MKTNTLKYLLLVVAAVSGLYFKLKTVEFFMIMYFACAILFINQFSDENKHSQSASKLTRRLLSGLFLAMESRTPALFALLILVLLPVLVIFNKITMAEQLAIYAYYLLVMAVVLRVLEVKLGIERKSYLLSGLKD